MARERPVYHQAFGVYLCGLREAMQWTQSDVERYAKREELPVTRQQVLRLEEGQTKFPKPEVLRALATLYEVPYADIAGKFIETQFGLMKNDLPRHGDGVVLAPQPSPGRRHAAEVSRVQARFNGLFRDVRQVARALSVVLDRYTATADVPATTGRASGAKRRRRTP